MDSDLLRHAPGLGGALLAALMKWKDGAIVVAVQFVMGAVPVMVLRQTIELFAKRMEVPSELVGFGVGLMAVAVALKATETVMKLEFAKPFNERIARWTGAKPPNDNDDGPPPPAPKSPVVPPVTEGPQP